MQLTRVIASPFMVLICPIFRTKVCFVFYPLFSAPGRFSDLPFIGCLLTPMILYLVKTLPGTVTVIYSLLLPRNEGSSFGSVLVIRNEGSNVGHSHCHLRRQGRLTVDPGDYLSMSKVFYPSLFGGVEYSTKVSYLRHCCGVFRFSRVYTLHTFQKVYISRNFL